MNIFKVLNIVNDIHNLSGQYMEVVSKYLTILAIPVLVIALLNCFLGHKLFKILVGIVGLSIGALLGTGICIGINMSVAKNMPSNTIIVLSALIGAAFLGFTSYKLYKAGAFCMGFIAGVILGAAVIKLMNKDDYVIAGVIGGLLMGLLAIDLYKHVVILLTSANGGLVSAACIAVLTKNYNPVFVLKLGVILAIIGIVFQYIILFVSNKKREDEEEIEESKEDKSISKRKKEVVKIQENKSKRKQKKNDKRKRRNTKQKEAAYQSEFFLVEIISHIAQGIKDFIENRLDGRNDNENGYEEEFEESYDDEFEKNYDEEVEDSYDGELIDAYKEVNETNREADKRDDKKTIVIKENEELPETLNIRGNTLEQKLIDEVTIPMFELDEIGQKLVAELDNNMAEKEEELEDLIIKETMKNIEN